jgi:uncharacterized protein YjbI with pentapeptide repeats
VTKPPDWVAAEVTRVTLNRDVDAERLTESLTRLAAGVDEWNQYREENPDFIPFLPGVRLLPYLDAIGPLDGIDFSGGELTAADLDQTQLAHANFTGATLDDASFEEASLEGADFSNASLEFASFDEGFANFAIFHGAALERAQFVQAELMCADFQGANLHRANLGSADAQDSFWMKAHLEGAQLDGTKLERADLSEADLTYAMLIDTDLTGADLSGAHVYGASVWGVELDGARQQSLVVTHWNEPVVYVDDLEVAQFLYTMLNHAKLRKAIAAVSSRGVLLLGRFSDGGLDLLQSLADGLRERGYLPIIFDFDRLENQSLTETVMVLVGLSRFVVANLSGPSVPQELYATVPHFKIPFVPIVEADRKPHGMAPDLLEYPWVVNPVLRFQNAADLLERLDAEVIAPAEEVGEARRKRLAELFEPQAG